MSAAARRFWRWLMTGWIVDSCDLCEEHPANWLVDALSGDGERSVTTKCCDRCVDYYIGRVATEGAIVLDRPLSEAAA